MIPASDSFRLTVVVPAAGRSSRMVRFKPLLPWPPDSSEGSTVIESTIRSIRTGLLRMNPLEWTLIVVCGHRFSEMSVFLQARFEGIRVIENPDPDAPMSSSIRCAMPLAPGGSHVMVLPGDHPAVRPDTIRDVVRKAMSDPGSIVVPLYAGRRGHPVIFPPHLHRRLAQPDPESGLRAIIHDPGEAVEVMETGDPGILLNLDYPSDYRTRNS